MASFNVQIRTNNDAFRHGDLGTEVARILRKLADRVDGLQSTLEPVDGAKLFDINGNSVGSVKVTS